MRKKIAFITFISTLSCMTSACNKIWIPTQPQYSDLRSQYKGQTAESWAEVKSKSSPIRGWDYVIERLEKNNIPRNKLNEIYSSPQIPYWTPITYKVRPNEAKIIYKELGNKRAQINAKEFLNLHIHDFQKAEKTFSVPKEVIASILQIETRCGQNTGKESVIYWLSRLVSAGFPPNIVYNYKNSKETPRPSLKELEERAAWLEEEFIPHLIAVIKISEESGDSPFDIKGSAGGAIGMAQFLPKNVERFGIDGDNNGTVNLFSPADAIFSVANFLKQHGWRKNLSEKEKNDVILEYNRSSAYANTVLTLANDLKK